MMSTSKFSGLYPHPASPETLTVDRLLFLAVWGLIVIAFPACRSGAAAGAEQVSSTAMTDEGTVDDLLARARTQYALLSEEALAANRIPRTLTPEGEMHWTREGFDWTEGFFPGTLWYFHELTGNKKWREQAEKFQQLFESHKARRNNHDLGFVFNNSFGNGYRLTGNKAFRDVMITAGNSLLTRFDPDVGCIQSWDVDAGWQAKRGWKFPVIIDNMMNLELLFELTEITGNPTYREVAIEHANTTLRNHYRKDFSSYHVIDYDPETGAVRHRETAQGYAHGSAWARGQAWGLYGYTVAYRYTRDPAYLELAENIASFIMRDSRIPRNRIPYWDYDAPAKAEQPRDASAAAITASALLELSGYSGLPVRAYAEEMLATLASEEYFAAVGDNHHFLLRHSVGSIPHGAEIDVPLSYADYYFVEALLRLRTLIAGKELSLLGQPARDHSVYWANYLQSRAADSDLRDPAADVDPRFIPNNFAYAGYHRGEKDLPDYAALADYRTFDIADYGAVPDDGKSDKEAIRATMRAIRAYQQTSATKGAVLYVPEGRFLIHAAGDDPGTIDLRASNFILRGAGQALSEWHMQQHLEPADPKKLWTTPELLELGAAKRTAKQPATKITTSHPAGTTRTVTVADTRAFRAGDYVELKGLITDRAKIRAAVAPYQLEHTPGDPADFIWKDITDGLDKIEKHQIVSITGNNIHLAAPLAHTIDAADDWTLTKIQPAAEVGIEHLTISGNWQEDFVHHKSALHDGGYSLISLRNATNSWLRNVTLRDFNEGILWQHTFNLTAEDILLQGNAGHSSFSIQYGNNNLTRRVNDQANTWHAPGFSKYSVSNVHQDMQYLATSTSDLHGQQGMYNLFDRTKGGWVRHRWGGALRNQPNHLAGLFYWNHENTGPAAAHFELMDTKSDYGRLIMPHLVGLHGESVHIPSREFFTRSIREQGRADYADLLPDLPQAYLESPGTPVLPHSLYEAQRRLRFKTVE